MISWLSKVHSPYTLPRRRLGGSPLPPDSQGAAFGGPSGALLKHTQGIAQVFAPRPRSSPLPSDGYIYTLGNSSDVVFSKNGTSNVKDDGNAALDWDDTVGTPVSNYLFSFSINASVDKALTSDKTIISTKTHR